MPGGLLGAISFAILWYQPIVLFTAFSLLMSLSGPCHRAFTAKLEEKKNLGAISGILAGGILGFGAAEWSVLLETFAMILHFCWCFVFVSLQDPNSEASAAPLEISGQGPLLCFGCWWWFWIFLCGFCLLLFALFSLVFFWAWSDSGLRYCPFSTFDSSKRDIAIASVQFVHQHDNVRRPGESHRGAGRKKNTLWRCCSCFISCERVAPAQVKSQFYINFCRSTPISCERVARGQVKAQLFLNFWRSTLISCETVDVSWLTAGTTLGLKRERYRRREREKGERKERRCEGEKMWEKVWGWADVKMSRCERRCEDDQMWEKMWQKMWENERICERRCERRCEDVKMSRCEDEQMCRWEDEQMWEKMWEKMWENVKEDVREDVKMSRCEDEQMWEKMWRWANVRMSRCERRCEDEQMWRWADVKMRRWRWEGEKMRRWEGKIQTPIMGRTCAQTLSGKTLNNSQLQKPNALGNRITLFWQNIEILTLKCKGSPNSVSMKNKWQLCMTIFYSEM